MLPTPPGGGARDLVDDGCDEARESKRAVVAYVAPFTGTAGRSLSTGDAAHKRLRSKLVIVNGMAVCALMILHSMQAYVLCLLSRVGQCDLTAH